jgi:hypothetical protein
VVLAEKKHRDKFIFTLVKKVQTLLLKDIASTVHTLLTRILGSVRQTNEKLQHPYTQVMAFWVLTPCSNAEEYLSFGRSYWLHLQGEVVLGSAYMWEREYGGGAWKLPSGSAGSGGEVEPFLGPLLGSGHKKGSISPPPPLYPSMYCA